MSKVSDSVYELVLPIAESMNLFLVEVVYDKKYNGMNLTVVIDKEGGVSIDDCERLHRAIDLPLEELNPTQDKAYVLNVSSPGLDRPLTIDWDYKRNMGNDIRVKLFAPVDGAKEFIGKLVSYDSENFTIIDEKNVERTFNRTKTASVTPIIKF